MTWEGLWYHRRARWLSLLLLPVSWVYAWGARLNRARHRPQRVEGLTVISVGNIVAGGAGKTPFVIWLAQWARSAGKRVAVLSRGHGRRSTDILHLSGTSPVTSVEAGDEPALMHRRLPEVEVWVGSDRLELARLAKKHGADVAILDDGFQHHRLARDLDIVIVGDLGNQRALPAGPLREPLSVLQHAQVIIGRGGSAEGTPHTSHARHAAFQWELTAFVDEVGRTHPLHELQGVPLVALSGIARPAEFERQLTLAGAQVKAHAIFGDHHHFTDAELRTVRALAASHRARIITTEKDRERLGNRLDVLTTRYEVRPLSGLEHLAETLGWPVALVAGGKG